MTDHYAYPLISQADGAFQGANKPGGINSNVCDAQ